MSSQPTPRPRLLGPLAALTLLTLVSAHAVGAQDVSNANNNSAGNTTETTAGGAGGRTAQPPSEVRPPVSTQGPGAGQGTTTVQTGATNQTTQPPANPNASPTPALKVIEVQRADVSDPKERDRAGLYNTIRVRVQNLAGWLQTPTNDPGKFILYLNAYPLPGVRARLDSETPADRNPRGAEAGQPAVVPSTTDRYLLFDLDRTDDPDTQKAWRDVLNRPQLFPWPRAREVSVSVGYDALDNQSDETAIPTAVDRFLLVDVNPFWFGWFAAFLLVMLALFFWLARSSDLLRENGPEPTGKDRHGRPNRKPYSLGRSQMAFWFFLVITSFLFIWMVTSNGDTITGTVLGLIGISATTALGSVIISNSKSEQVNAERLALEAERTELETRIAPLETKTNASPPTASADEVRELTARRERLYKVNQLLAGASKGFFTDILSDAGGVSFHRFQIVAWTLALGFIFLAQVFNYLMMPDFNATLLGLMGISSGTYLGFKFPERQA